MLLPLVRALHMAATLQLAGAALFELLFLHGALAAAAPGQVADTLRSLRRLGLAAVALAMVSWLAWLALLTVSMSGLDAARALSPQVLGMVVSGTTFGHDWAWRAGLFLVVLLALVVPVRGKGAARASLALRAAAGLALPASLAWTGHALGSHAGHLVADAIHATAAALWVGMLLPLWLVVRRAAAGPAWSGFAAAAARAFFLPGAIAVVLLAASGIVNALWLLDSVGDLFTTAYGGLLAAKLALFAGMLVLAAINRFSLADRIDDQGTEGSRAVRALRRSMLAEAALAAAILGLVGILGITPPTAREHESMPMDGKQGMHDM
jgi:putative copper resistance protein D